MVENKAHSSDDDLPLVYATLMPASEEEDASFLTSTISSNTSSSSSFERVEVADLDANKSGRETLATEKDAVLTAPRGKYGDLGELQPETPLLIEVDHEENKNGNDGDDKSSWEKKCRRCRRRKRRMVVGGVAGLVVGSILLCGPIGAVLGAVGGVWATRAISKRRENLKEQRSGIKLEERPVVAMADDEILKQVE